MNAEPSVNRSPCAPANPARGLIRWLYCNNPFYVISAGLVFFGLRASFDPNGRVFEVWSLLVGMAGYTLLLAGTACLLIRLGDVWDDMRTLMLLVVLMFLSISVIFDDTMTCHPQLGKLCYVGGLLFSMAVSEGLLFGVRLRMPAFFRLPYYLFLSLFFLFPVAISPLLTSPANPMAVAEPALPWALFAFPVLAGLITLTLVPAARRGAEYVRGNGSPWRWPLYPWSLFVVLGVGVCARSYYACISLHPVERSGTIFGLYFLVPFFFAVALLLMEIGLASGRKGAVRTALAAPAVFVVLASLGRRDDPAYFDFLMSFAGVLGGSPLYFAVLAAGLFYGYARIRRAPAAVEGLGAALATLTLVGPNTFDFGQLTAPNPLPLALLTVLQTTIAVRRQSCGRGVFGACCFVATVLSGPAEPMPTAAKTSLLLHLAMFATLVLGAIFANERGLALRIAGAILLFLLGADGASEQPRLLAIIPVAFVPVYPALAAATAASYGWLLKSRVHVFDAGAILALWASIHGWRGYARARSTIGGLDHIVWGLVFFVLAALISLAKAGVLRRWSTRPRKPRHGIEME